MARRAVLAGCGAMSKGWLEAVASTPALRDEIDIVGLVDLDLSLAKERAAERQLGDVVVGVDLAAVLSRTRADLLFDVVPPSARRTVVETGLAHGCHVLSEKPMALSLEDARALVRGAEAARVMHAVVQNRRFNTGVRRIRATLESGILGQLIAVHSDFFVGAHFGGFRDLMQNVLLLDMAIHTFDAARFMSGKEPLAVYCHESNPASSWYAHGSAANAIFEFSDDVVVTYRGSWSAEGANTSWDASWRIIGSKGTILWDGEDNLTAHIVDGDSGFLRPLRQVDVLPPADPGQTHGHASVLAEFLDAIARRREPETSGRDNLKSLGMVFAAIESARTRQRVLIAS
jgi:predicted dehydrogenase